MRVGVDAKQMLRLSGRMNQQQQAELLRCARLRLRLERPQRFRVGLQRNIPASRAEPSQHRHRSRQEFVGSRGSKDDRLEGVDGSCMQVRAAAFVAGCFASHRLPSRRVREPKDTASNPGDAMQVGETFFTFPVVELRTERPIILSAAGARGDEPSLVPPVTRWSPVAHFAGGRPLLYRQLSSARRVLA